MLLLEWESRAAKPANIRAEDADNNNSVDSGCVDQNGITLGWAIGSSEYRKRRDDTLRVSLSKQVTRYADEMIYELLFPSEEKKESNMRSLFKAYVVDVEAEMVVFENYYIASSRKSASDSAIFDYAKADKGVKSADGLVVIVELVGNGSEIPTKKGDK